MSCTGTPNYRLQRTASGPSRFVQAGHDPRRALARAEPGRYAPQEAAFAGGATGALS